MPRARSTDHDGNDAPMALAGDHAGSPDAPDRLMRRGNSVTSALAVGPPPAGVVLLPGDANLKGIQELAAALWNTSD
jgi:hypothetical protein